MIVAGTQTSSSYREVGLLLLLLLLIIIIKLIEGDSIQAWLTAGVTYLIPKNENTGNSKNYRPVTSLPTTYKLITSIIRTRMQKYMDNENLLPKEQKGYSGGTKGCKE